MNEESMNTSLRVLDEFLTSGNYARKLAHITRWLLDFFNQSLSAASAAWNFLAFVLRFTTRYFGLRRLFSQ
jgi:hypothetical protein